ncbi:MAG: DUF6516 family protein [Candidatus Competibacteraceae bacterium]
MTDDELEILLSLDGLSYEAAAGYIVEFSARRTDKTPERPHGISYALLFRPKAGGPPYVKFDNAHAVKHRGGKYVSNPTTYDHWHRTEKDIGRPYRFINAVQLLEDFWHEVKRVMDEKGICNDL